MKKKLLLSFAVFATALSVSAQDYKDNDYFVKQKIELPKQKRASVKGDMSLFYAENNSRITSELNKFLGTTGDKDGGFDTLFLYSYKVRERATKNNDKYWQQVIQGIPTSDSLVLHGFDFVGQGLNSAGSNVVVNVMKKDFKTVITSKTVKITGDYGIQNVSFDIPAIHNDSMIISMQMATVADSFVIAKSHNQFNNDSLGTKKLFTSSLPFYGDAATFATQSDNGAILGQTGGNFDFLIFPYFSYNLKADFEASKTTINRTDTVIFTKKNDSHFHNPILNYIKWNHLANNTPFAYSSFIFDQPSGEDFDTSVVSKQFNTKGVFKVKQKVFLLTWLQGQIVEDSSEVTITVNPALSLELQSALNNLNIYPNPVSNELNVKFNATSAATIELVNVAGQVLATKNASEFVNVTFDTAELNAGVYFVNIKVAEGTFTQKIIKE
jgi:hypothetical protein